MDSQPGDEVNKAWRDVLFDRHIEETSQRSKQSRLAGHSPRSMQFFRAYKYAADAKCSECDGWPITALGMCQSCYVKSRSKI